MHKRRLCALPVLPPAGPGLASVHAASRGFTRRCVRTGNASCGSVRHVRQCVGRDESRALADTGAGTPCGRAHGREVISLYDGVQCHPEELRQVVLGVADAVDMSKVGERQPALIAVAGRRRSENGGPKCMGTLGWVHGRKTNWVMMFAAFLMIVPRQE